MRVLIIGGTGVISRSITRFLVARGDDVTHYNRGITEAVDKNTKTIQGDRKDLNSFERSMRSAGQFDCVIDMLCFTLAEAESAIKIFKGRTGQYIFCSSVDVYSKTGQAYPINENAEKKPSTEFHYAVGKAACEQLLFASVDKYFPVTVFRPAQTYGEGGTLVHSLGFDPYYFHRLLTGQPLIVHGDGSSLWTTCHSEDVGKAFVAAIGNSNAFGKAYNVTGEDWMTWNRYHREVAEAIGAPEPEIIHIPTDVLKAIAPVHAYWCVVNFQYNNIFDNSLAKKDLNFKQTISWKEGVKRTFQWLADRKRIEDNGSHAYYDAIITAWKDALKSAVGTE